MSCHIQSVYLCELCELGKDDSIWLSVQNWHDVKLVCVQIFNSFN